MARKGRAAARLSSYQSFREHITKISASAESGRAEILAGWCSNICAPARSVPLCFLRALERSESQRSAGSRAASSARFDMPVDARQMQRHRLLRHVSCLHCNNMLEVIEFS